MDDFIVLILTLLFIVAGVFGQMKKKPLPPESEGGPKPYRDVFRDMFKEEDEDEKITSQREYRKPVETAPEGDRFHSRGSVIERQFKPKKTTMPDLIQTPVEQPVSKSIRGSNFPLKKAFIYSEILNRKYF